MFFIFIVVLEANCLSVSRSHEFEGSATEILHTESRAITRGMAPGVTGHNSNSVFSTTKQITPLHWPQLPHVQNEMIVIASSSYSSHVDKMS